jgi:ABC-type Na+ transport system ATPase subunit NatA
MAETALTDPSAARAYRVLHAELGIVDAVAGLTPDERLRVLEAAAILCGLDDLAAQIRARRVNIGKVRGELLKLRDNRRRRESGYSKGQKRRPPSDGKPPRE